MSESLLKKDWNENDLQRIRNLIGKKFNDKTKIQVGYKKTIKEYNEGEIFEENGKKWKIENGIKINIGKLDDIRNIFNMPLLCPKCGKTMKSHLDKKFYLYHKTCFNCVVEFEQKLRIEGKWEEYQQNIIKNSTKQMLEELEKEMDEFLNSNETFVTERGDVEDWGELNKNKIKEEIKEYIKNIKFKLNI